MYVRICAYIHIRKYTVKKYIDMISCGTWSANSSDYDDSSRTIRTPTKNIPSWAFNGALFVGLNAFALCSLTYPQHGFHIHIGLTYVVEVHREFFCKITLISI